MSWRAEPFELEVAGIIEEVIIKRLREVSGPTSF